MNFPHKLLQQSCYATHSWAWGTCGPTQLLEGIEVKAPGQRRHYVMSFPLRFRCSLNLTQIFV